MSSTAPSPWRHPVLRLHHRRVERHLVPAVEAAAELGVALNAETVRQALRYQRWTFLRRLRGFAYLCVAIAVMGAALYVPACTPGGRLTLTPAECSSVFAYFDLGTPSVFFALLGTVLAGIWITAVWNGEFIAKCSEPLYLLLDLLTMAAAVFATEGTDYTDAAKLASKTTSELRRKFWELPGHLAKEFGYAGDIREQMGDHTKRVLEALESDAVGLAANRREAARMLGLHFAEVVDNLAAGRFTHLLSAAVLPSSEPDSDRTAERYLVWACAKSGLLAIALVSAGVWSGLGAGVLAVAVPVFILTAYLMLLHRHGLVEASRLIREVKAHVRGDSEANPAP